MRPEGVGLVDEGVDPAVGVVEVAAGQVPGRVELAAPGAVVALDAVVGFGRSGGRFEEADAALAAFAPEVGLGPGAAVDLDGLDGEGHVGLELVEEALGLARSRVGGLGRGSAWRRARGRRSARARGFRVPGRGRRLGRSRPGTRGRDPLEASGAWPVAPGAAMRGLASEDGAGAAAPRSTSFSRMLPAVLRPAVRPWRRGRRASLALPRIGWSARASRAVANRGVHSVGRVRRGRRERGVGRPWS